MRRITIPFACAALFLFIGIVQAQSRLSIRAASVQPVEGWQAMQVEHCQSRCTVWVSSTAAVTENDIESAQPEVRADGYRVINVVFTDAGANKWHDLMAAQLRNLVVLVVDNKVIWAPTVTYIPSATTKEAGVTGATPRGLTQEEVDGIMAILRPAQPR